MGSRSENRSYLGLGREFVESAMRGGCAPDSLVGEWLDSSEYAPHAAAYATNVSEDDVLRIVHSAGNVVGREGAHEPRPVKRGSVE